MKRGIPIGLLFASLACAQIPRNLDFREGEPGQAPAHWSIENASAQVSHDGCAPSPACIILTGGEIRQTLDAKMYRDKPIRLSAWLRDGAQLRIRVNRRAQPADFLNNRADRPVRSTDWTQSEIMLVVPVDAESIEFGVTSLGPHPARIRDVTLDILDGFPFNPRNLDFAEGEPDQLPPGWNIESDHDGFKVVTTAEDCRTGPLCAVLTGAGSLIQTLNAAPYIGKTLRLRASVKLEPAGPSDSARFFLLDDARQVRSAEWTGYEITRTIDAGSATVSFGLSLSGSGSARIDSLFLDVLPQGPPEVRPVNLGALPLAAPSLSALAPSQEETRRVVNDAAEKALAWSRTIPNFICTQTIQRAENRNGNGWKAEDVLTVQLGSADGREYHKLLAVNNRPTKLGYDSVRGATSAGEFGGALNEIFRPGAAAFWWDSDTTLRGHPVRAFRYEIDAAKSEFELRFPVTSWSKVVGHHGLVYVERETGHVLRVVQIAYVPKDAPLLGSTESMDYDYADIGGTQYLLPLKAEMLLTAAGVQFRNEIDFHDYRKFTAESSLTFDDPAPH